VEIDTIPAIVPTLTNEGHLTLSDL